MVAPSVRLMVEASTTVSRVTSSSGSGGGTTGARSAAVACAVGVTRSFLRTGKKGSLGIRRSVYTEPVLISTYSIVAADPDTHEAGVAVASRALAVGAIVPWARAHAGAVATQAWANPTYGPRALDLMEMGVAPQEVIQNLTLEDEERALRQAGAVHASGAAATYTGADCLPWAGGRSGKGFACQGNILAGPQVIEAMVSAFQGTRGDLPERLLAALVSGEQTGGDSRGKQAAALLVVKPNAGYAGLNDRLVDLRVDDHPAPVQELERIFGIWRGWRQRSEGGVLTPVEGTIASEVQRALDELGFYRGPHDGTYSEATRAAFAAYLRSVGAADRIRDDAFADRKAVNQLRRTAGERRAGRPAG